MHKCRGLPKLEVLVKATVSQLAAYAGKSERTIHRYLASGKWPHTRLAGGLVEIDDSLIIGPPDEQEGLVLAALARIEQKLDALSAHVDTLSAGHLQVTHHARITANLPLAQSELPPELTPWRNYVREKGYSETTISRAIKRGEIPVVHGPWKRGHAVIQDAISEEGKQAIDKLYGKA